MDVKLAGAPRIDALTEGPPSTFSLLAPYTPRECRDATELLLPDPRSASLGLAMKDAKTSRTEAWAEDAAQGVTSAERGVVGATSGQRAIQAASRVLLQGEAIEDVVNSGGHNSSGLAKGISALGIAGGVAQTTTGVEQLRRGELGEGGKNVTAGGLTTAAGATELLAAAHVAKKAVPVLAGAAGVVDGVGDVVKGVRESDTEKVVVGGLKSAGGAMLAAAPFVGGTVVGAPVGAVLGVAGGVVLGGAELYDAYQHFTAEKK